MWAAMKSSLQIGLTLAIVVALVVGVTILSHYTGTGGTRPKETVAEVRPHLLFLDPPAEKSVVEDFEVGKPYQRDFWFRSPTAGTPVNVTLKYKPDHCSRVEIGALTAAEAEQLGLANLKEDAKLLAFLKTNAEVGAILDKEKRWQKLEHKGDKISIPAESTVGLVRLAWKKDSPGEDYVQIELQTSQGNEKRKETVVVAARFGAPVRVRQDRMAIHDLNVVGQEETVEILCFSPTRERFSLTAKEARDHPCFTCTLKPLTTQELATQAKEVGAQKLLSGYRVTVKVQERAPNSKVLSLGPFGRRIILTPDTEQEPLEVLVTGMVRGELGMLDDNLEPVSLIDLQTFRTQRGISKTMVLVAEKPGLELELKSSQPEYLEAKLTSLPAAGGKQRWNLVVDVPPNKHMGNIPNGQVILQIKGGRTMEIPVRGLGTQ